MGMTEFYADSGAETITFSSNYMSSSQEGVLTEGHAKNYELDNEAVKEISWSLMYLQTYCCPSGYLLNPTTNLCVSCHQPFCIDCGGSSCNECAYGYHLQFNGC